MQSLTTFLDKKIFCFRDQRSLLKKFALCKNGEKFFLEIESAWTEIVCFLIQQFLGKILTKLKQSWTKF